MNAKLTAPSRAVAVALFLSVAFSTGAFASSKSDRVAQAAKYAGTAAGKAAPIVRVGSAAVRGWRCAAYEWERRKSLIRYNVDIGRCRL